MNRLKTYSVEIWVTDCYLAEGIHASTPNLPNVSRLTAGSRAPFRLWRTCRTCLPPMSRRSRHDIHGSRRMGHRLPELRLR